MMRIWKTLGAAGLILALQGSVSDGQSTPANPGDSSPDVPRKKTRTKRGAPAKSEEPSESTQRGAAGRLGDPNSFAGSVAPILVANCIRCHDDRQKRGGLDQTTFKGLRTGGEGGPVLEPGNPEASRLVQMIKGEGDGRRMPPGDTRLSPEAIGRIEAWVKSGARLDAGLDADQDIRTYAATPEQVRRAELARLKPEERDQRLRTTALERIRKADPDSKPEMTSGAHFAVFSDLPKDRVDATIKVMEGLYGRLRQMLTTKPNVPALDWSEKLSVYVFRERPAYVEFVRSVEGREVDPNGVAHGNLSVETPYLAVVDPLAGAEEPPPSRKSSRNRKSAADSSEGPERTLNGLLTEQLGTAVLGQEGKPPRWLSLGFGAYLASQIEPRSPYFARLRAIAFDQFQLGWTAKANEALGGQTDDEKVRAIGFAVLEYLAANWRPALPSFIIGMLEGQEKLDDVIGSRFNANRQQFLDASGRWVGLRYGRSR